MSRPYNLTPRGLTNLKRGLKRSWQEGGSHRARQQRGIIDADTLRSRALYDRRGCHYATIMMNGRHYEARWSTDGRTDQVDLFATVFGTNGAPNSELILMGTMRPSLLLARIGELCA